MPRKKKEEISKENNEEKLEFDFKDSQYNVIDKVREDCKQKRANYLKILAIDRSYKKKVETVKITAIVPKKLYKKIKEESEETGLSIQEIFRTLLIKRYKIL